MKFSLKHLFIAFALLLSSCGGVIGNIEQYDYPISTEDLKNSVAKVLAENPEFLVGVNGSIYARTDTTLKSMGQMIVINSNKRYILRFSYLDYNDSPRSSNISTISLNSGAEYGEVLPLAADLSYFEKKKYQKLFEDYFISKLPIEKKAVN